MHELIAAPFLGEYFLLRLGAVARHDPQPFKRGLAAVAHERARHRLGASSAVRRFVPVFSPERLRDL